MERRTIFKLGLALCAIAMILVELLPSVITITKVEKEEGTSFNERVQLAKDGIDNWIHKPSKEYLHIIKDKKFDEELTETVFQELINAEPGLYAPDGTLMIDWISLAEDDGVIRYNEHTIEIYDENMPGVLVLPDDVLVVSERDMHESLTVPMFRSLEFNRLQGIVFGTETELIAGFAKANGLKYAYSKYDNMLTITEKSFSQSALFSNNGYVLLGDTLVLSSADEAGEAIIPDGTIFIGKEAFKDNDKITEVDFPDTVREIGFRAFCNCTGLEQVKLGKNVERINGAFYFCRNLKKVKLNDGLKEIKGNAFSYTAVQNIKIPESVELIDKVAFPEGAYDIVEIVNGVYAYIINDILLMVKSNIITNNDIVFEDIKRVANLELNNSCNNITFTEKIQCLPSNFMFNGSVDKLVFEKQVNTIYANAFFEVIVKDLQFDSIGTIKQSAFNRFTTGHLVLSEETVIETGAFNNCNMSITIEPYCIVEKGAFKNCILDSVIISNKAEVSEDAFLNCTMNDIKYVD